MYERIWQFVCEHSQAIGFGFLYALIAAISTMPAPGHPVSFYEWLYDWTHTLINSPGAARFKPHPLPDSQPKQ